jgi:CBS-domain-containing membrane protein
MKVNKMLLVSAVGVGFFALSVASASASIVCSGNVCWHTAERHAYPPEARVVIHEDTWKPAADARITFREHSGRGYWRDDKWTEW